MPKFYSFWAVTDLHGFEGAIADEGEQGDRWIAD